MNVPGLPINTLKADAIDIWCGKTGGSGEDGKPVLLMVTKNIIPSPTVKSSVTIAIPDLKGQIYSLGQCPNGHVQPALIHAQMS